jgi:hypothetical protein
MTNSRYGGWRALHLFCRGTKLQEHLLLDKLLLLVMRLHEKGEVLSWFYSRYSGGGAHLRLRLFRPTELAMKRLRAAGERLLLSLPDRQRDDELEDLDVLDANPFMLREATVELEFDNSRTVEFDYEPEFARYGGVAAMPISERLFQRSSETAAVLMSQTLGKRSLRMVSAVNIMIITASRFGVLKEELPSFFAAYADYWSVFLNAKEAKLQYDRQAADEARALSGRLTSQSLIGKELPQDDVLAAWSLMVEDVHTNLEELANLGMLLVPYSGQPVVRHEDRLEAMRSIAWSHIHMMNNRLGMTPSYEYYLARVAQRLCELSNMMVDKTS